MQILFNKSIVKGKIPTELKKAIITDLYKTENRSEIGNYRPVSVLSSISKILEKIVHKLLHDFLQINTIQLPV